MLGEQGGKWQVDYLGTARGQNGPPRLEEPPPALLRKMPVDGPTHSLVFSPDSKRLYGSDNYWVRAWEVESGRELWTQKNGGGTLAVSPNGKWLAIGRDGYGSAEVLLWNAEDGSERYQVGEHGGSVDFVSFRSDTELLTGSWDETFRRWSLGEEPSELSKVEVDSDGGEFRLSPDGRTLLAGHGELRLFDVASGEDRGGLGDGYPRFVNIREDGKLVVLDMGNQYDVDDFPRDAEFDEFNWFTTIDIDATGDQPNRQYLMRVPSGNVPNTMTPDGRLLFIAADYEVLVWDTVEARLVDRLRGHERPVTSMSLSPDGRWLATGLRERFGDNEPESPESDAVHIWRVPNTN